VIKLRLPSIELCILSAFIQYIRGSAGPIIVSTADGKVNVVCEMGELTFRCYLPGYGMCEEDIKDLQKWCRANPGDLNQKCWEFGYCETRNQSLAISLKDYSHLTFDFEVRVVGS
jgi:hypothetical protein